MLLHVKFQGDAVMSQEQLNRLREQFPQLKVYQDTMTEECKVENVAEAFLQAKEPAITPDMLKSYLANTKQALDSLKNHLDYISQLPQSTAGEPGRVKQPVEIFQTQEIRASEASSIIKPEIVESVEMPQQESVSKSIETAKPLVAEDTQSESNQETVFERLKKMRLRRA